MSKKSVSSIVLALAIIATVPALVSAANWVLLGGTPGNDMKLYVDSASLKYNGPTIRYWSRLVYDKDKERREYSVSLAEANCSSGQTRMLQSTVYYFDNTNKSYYSPSNWVYPTPESLGEAEFNYVCSLGKSG